jgi:hypothetical protein
MIFESSRYTQLLKFNPLREGSKRKRKEKQLNITLKMSQGQPRRPQAGGQDYNTVGLSKIVL